MKLIVGLGNPGSLYAKTRHNIGRQLVESLAKKHKSRWKTNPSFQSQLAEVQSEKGSVLLALPETFMNESGKAVDLLVGHFNINPQSNLLVVMDDVALPFGKLRLRAAGTDGGHQGLRSIVQTLGSEHYARLRIGIGPAESVLEPLEKFVLKPFSKEEKKKLPNVLKRGIDSCLLWVTKSIEKAMDATNKPLPSEPV